MVKGHHTTGFRTYILIPNKTSCYFLISRSKSLAMTTPYA